MGVFRVFTQSWTMVSVVPSDVSPCPCPEGFPKDRGEVFVLGTKVLVLVLVLENILSGDAFFIQLLRRPHCEFFGLKISDYLLHSRSLDIVPFNKSRTMLHVSRL